MQPRFNDPKKQLGVALFISLVLLLILTIIGVSSVQTTSLEVRMSRNEHDTLLAFQSAESALVDAEAQLDGITSTTVFDDSSGLYELPVVGDLPQWDNAGVWSGTNSVEADQIDGTAARARYIIEYIGPVQRPENAHQLGNQNDLSAGVDRVEMFRITARGIGGTQNSQVLLQSTFGRILD